MSNAKRATITRPAEELLCEVLLRLLGPTGRVHASLQQHLLVELLLLLLLLQVLLHAQALPLVLLQLLRRVARLSAAPQGSGRHSMNAITKSRGITKGKMGALMNMVHLCNYSLMVKSPCRRFCPSMVNE